MKKWPKQFLDIARLVDKEHKIDNFFNKNESKNTTRKIINKFYKIWNIEILIVI